MTRPTLMYHDVIAAGESDASGFPGGAAAHYKLDERAFASHLAALAASGLQFDAVSTPVADATCLLSFDDGGASAVAIGEALDHHAMRGHFFITTSHIGQRGFVTSQDLRTLHAGGHVVGSHSHTHPAEISRLTAGALDAEWRISVDCLNQHLGAPITVASVPGGFYAMHVAQAAAAVGIRYLFTSEPTVRMHTVDGCLVLGRYALWHDTSPARAVALALGTHAARQRQWLAWNTKKPLKRWARPVYQRLRRQWLDGTSRDGAGDSNR